MSVQAHYEPPKVDPLALIAAAKAPAELAGAGVLLAASQPLVPVELGDLKASGKVTPTPAGAEVSYSAVDPEDGYNYAVIQHERMDFHHPNGGQAHFLSQPMETEQSVIVGEMVRVAREGGL